MLDCSIAWFGVDGITAKVKSVTNSAGQVTVDKVEKTAVVNFDILTVEVQVVNPSTKTKLEYAHYKASTGSYNLETGHIVGGSFVPVADGLPYDPNGTLYAEVQVRVGYDTSKFESYTVGADTLWRVTGEDSKKYDAAFVMTSVSGLTVDVTAAVNAGSSRARIFPLSTGKYQKTDGTNADGKANENGDKAYHTLSLSALSTKDSKTAWTTICNVYVDGGEVSGTSLAGEASATAQSITTVTVSDPAYGA